MKRVPPIRGLTGLLIFGLGLATGLVAQTTGDSPNRVEQKRTDLTVAPGMEVIASIVEYKPGESGELHSHHGVEAAYVLQGATLQSQGKDPNTVSTGATIMNLRDVKHGGFKVVGDTSYKLFTVHIVDKGKPLYDYANCVSVARTNSAGRCAGVATALTCRVNHASDRAISRA